MRNKKIMQKISNYKEKNRNIQKKLTDIKNILERNEEKEIFEVCKSIIEPELEKLDFEIFHLETCVDFLVALADGNGNGGFRRLTAADVDDMVNEQVVYSEKFIKSTLAKIENQLVNLEERLKLERKDESEL